jgi:hypothetical protein
LKFSIVKDHDEPKNLLFETLYFMWECFSMGTELPTKVMLGQKLVLTQMTFLNNVRDVGRLVPSRTSCYNVVLMKILLIEISGSHGGEYEDGCLGACCLHHQNDEYALIMEAANTAETSVNFFKTTRRNNREDSHLRKNCYRLFTCF